MRQSTLSKQKLSYLAFSALIGSRAWFATSIIAMSIIAILIGSVELAAVVRGSHHESTTTAAATKLSTPQPSAQAGAKPGRLFARLSHQPEADKLRRILGQRFLAPGREVMVLTGALSVGTNVSQITITRTQRDDGEQVHISVGAVSPRMTWSPGEGSRVDGDAATGSTRAVMERLVLDSPDEFVLAQLRGASYYTVARSVMPKNAAGSEDYTGPTWDVVRVGEPNSAGTAAPLSHARSFHINTSTGLVDRCFSQEAGDTVVAEMSGWVDQSGEKVPTHITCRTGPGGVRLDFV